MSITQAHHKGDENVDRDSTMSVSQQYVKQQAKPIEHGIHKWDKVAKHTERNDRKGDNEETSRRRKMSPVREDRKRRVSVLRKNQE